VSLFTDAGDINKELQNGGQEHPGHPRFYFI